MTTGCTRRQLELQVSEAAGWWPKRVVGIALGHEDLVGHDELRIDPLLAAVLGSSSKVETVRRELVPRQIPARVLKHFVEQGLLSRPEFKKLLGSAS